MRAVVLINGALAIGSAIAGLFFLLVLDPHARSIIRVLRSCVWILCLDWVVIAILAVPSEITYSLYPPRLLAFVLVPAGIIDKNRSRL